jgi:hypothetical protein
MYPTAMLVTDTALLDFHLVSLAGCRPCDALPVNSCRISLKERKNIRFCGSSVRGRWKPVYAGKRCQILEVPKIMKMMMLHRPGVRPVRC